MNYVLSSLQVLYDATTDGIERVLNNAIDHRRKVCTLVADVDLIDNSNY